MVTKTGTAGADNLVGTDGNDILQGLGGNDQLTGGKDADLLDGGSGVDTAGYGDSGEGATVNLLFNIASGGTAAGDTFAGVENVTGSGFNDLILGNSFGNVLRGGAGADMLRGLAGNDVLNGGAGADKLEGQAGLDTADYSGAKQGVEVVLSLGEGLAEAGDATGDTWISIENVTGSAFGDRLQGDDGANVVKGGAGNDFILGGLGFDVLDGGDGVDTLIYFNPGTGVVINLNTNTVTGDFASGDSISHFENAQGSDLADDLIGDAGANRLDGVDGDDTILGLGGNDVIAGGDGADVLDGGEGVDTLDYSRSSVRVRFDLGVNFADAEGDTIKGFENLIGSRHDNSVAGSDGANMLSLGDGDDTMFGQLGRDELTGGAGADGFQYVQAADSGVTAAMRDVIHDFSQAQLDRLDLHNFDADDSKAGEQSFSFVGGNGFSAPGQVRFFSEGDHTVVALNTAGSSGAESTIQLDGQVILSAADFLL